MQFPRLGDEGDVSLLGPAVLMLGVLGVGGVLFWITKQGQDDYEPSDAVERVKNVIEAIETEEPDEEN